MTEKQRIKLFHSVYRQCIKRSSRYCSFDQYWPYKDFLEDILSGEDPIEFVYQDKLLTIQRADRIYFLTVENETEVFKQQFDSAEELIKNANIEGKSFKQLWNELK